MPFTIVHGTPQIIWAPVAKDDTLYVGQIVRSINEGVAPITTASGTADVASHLAAVGLIRDGSSANNVPFGIVVGTNLRTPSFDATYKTDKIAWAVASSATSSDYAMVEGPWAKGDKMSMVQVALLDPYITLRSPLYVDNTGTAPTLLTVASGASTLGATTNATDEAGVASLSTIYFRTGVVAGSYRICDDSSTTAHTWDNALNATCAVGDTAVKVNLTTNGLSLMQVDSEALFVDVGATVTTNYYVINVIRLDLSVAGKEYVDFRFNPYQFNCLDHNT